MSAREITADELLRVVANASGEDVFCGDDSGARTIAAGALDAWDELSEESQDIAIETARKAWSGSR